MSGWRHVWHTLLFLACAGCALAQGETRTIDLDWGTITVPAQATVGERYEIRVAYRDVPKTQLAADLHWGTADGEYGGFLAWGGNRPTIEGTGEHVFRPTVKAQDGMGTVHAAVFLTPTGEYADRTAEVRTEPVPVTVPADPLAEATYKKSWIWIDPAAFERTPTSGERWEVPVEYYLDPSEDDGGTKLTLWTAGPWIDNPDGTYTTRKGHQGYPGATKQIDATRGRHREVVVYTIPPAQQRNGLFLIARFERADGSDWPWELRSDHLHFTRADGFFELETDAPGNLFTYAEPVVFGVRLKQADPGVERRLVWRVSDTRGEEVARGELPFVAERAGQTLALPLAIERRGVFLLEASVDGWESRHASFARIPDVMAITGGAPTAFGMTNVVGPDDPERLAEKLAIARRLGLTTCRRFFSWKAVEPARGDRRLEAWDRAIALANEHGVRPWLCIQDPPAWAMTDEPGKVSFQTFRGDFAAMAETVGAMSERYGERLYGWEWLNEITPGGTPTPVEDYLALVVACSTAARAANPDYELLLAGGLWPQSFRHALLKAGVAEHITVLPIHYGNGGAVREAREDLAAVGAGDVAVWDDESARGISIWDAPPTFDLTHRLQRDWLLNNWPDELVNGCEQIVWFGGQGDPAGNWSYLLDDLTPRPVAATMAVFVSRVHGARPLGAFAVGEGGMFHLFEKDGRAVLLASSYVDGETVPLDVGAEQVTVVDDQGNESPLATPGGRAALTLGPQRVWIDGVDLDTVKRYLVAQPAVREAAKIARGAFKGTTQLVGTPRTTLLRGQSAELAVRVRNLYKRALAGRVTVRLPAGWPAPEPAAYWLAAGDETLLSLPLAIPADAAVAEHELAVVTELDGGLAPMARPLIVSVIDRASLGNQLAVGDFERGQGWGGAGRLAPAPGGLGLGQQVLRFEDSGGQWRHQSTTVPIRGGETYLYTAWIHNDAMRAGSNVTITMADGSTKVLYDLHVFTAGEATPWWQPFAARIDTPPEAVSLSLTPVANGGGWAMLDNLRLSLFEGTNWAADALRVAQPPAIDGDLADWTDAEPLPLIGKNQLETLADDYAFGPANLNGVAWLRWDAQNLYLAARVRDDVHAASEGERAPDGDALIVALDPSNRGPQARQQAFQLWLSEARPTGGSGRHTLYRPAEFAAGRKDGHLARDSSVYDIAVRRGGGETLYELRIPLSELGIDGQVGAKAGLSLLLTDNDGAGPAARLTWGEGLTPTWAPERLGVVTLVE